MVRTANRSGGRRDTRAEARQRRIRNTAIVVTSAMLLVFAAPVIARLLSS